jgi:hypothetical protein
VALTTEPVVELIDEVDAIRPPVQPLDEPRFDPSDGRHVQRGKDGRGSHVKLKAKVRSTITDLAVRGDLSPVVLSSVAGTLSASATETDSTT